MFRLITAPFLVKTQILVQTNGATKYSTNPSQYRAISPTAGLMCVCQHLVLELLEVRPDVVVLSPHPEAAHAINLRGSGNVRR